jgi:hypothetical protein
MLAKAVSTTWRNAMLTGFFLSCMLQSVDAMERHGKLPSVHAASTRPEHTLASNDGKMEVSLDRRGITHMRREHGEHAEMFPVHHHLAHQKYNTGVPGEVLLQEDPQTSVAGSAETMVNDIKEERAIQHEEAQPAVPHTPYNSSSQAQTEIEKLDMIVQDAEEKAGLPDSSITLPPPQPLPEESREDEEVHALLIIIISIVVVVCAASAGASIYIARKYQDKGGLAETHGEETEAETEAEAEAES